MIDARKVGNVRDLKVGVSPGTTTMVLGSVDNYAACPTPAATAFQVQSLGPPSDFSWMKPPPAWHRKWWPDGARAPSSSKDAAPAPSSDPNARNPASAKMPTPSSDPASRTAYVESPYADLVSLKGPGNLLRRLVQRLKTRQLGLILAPYGDISPLPYSEIADVENNVHYQCAPYDPQYNQRGEPGYYYDTPLGNGFAKHGVVGQGLAGSGLGALPTDLQLSRIYGYTPLVNGWVPGKYINAPGATWTQAPWTPPDGGGAYATWGPPLRGAMTLRQRLHRAFFGLGDDSPPADTATESYVDANSQVPSTLSPAERAVEILRMQQDRVFMLSVASTGAIVGGFLLNVIKDQREKRQKRPTPHHENAVSVPVSGARRRKRKRS